MRGPAALFVLLATGVAAVLAAPAARKPTISSEVPKKTAEVAVVFDDFAVASEARFARSRAEDAARLLSRSGLPTSFFPQSSLAAALAEPCRVAHLVQCSSISAADKSALDAFCARGGRVIVHGCFSAELAAWFGVEKPTLNWHTPKRGGSWTGFRLSEPRPLNTPVSLANRAAKVIRIGPAAPGVRVLARWTDASGTDGPPALLCGPKGYWFVRMLYNDGSARDRARLLSSLSCSLHPPLWKCSSKALEASAWRIAGAKDLAGAEAALVRLAGKDRAEIVRSIFHGIRKTEAARAELFSRGLYGAAQSNVLELVSEVRLARAAAIPLSAARGRKPLAVWLPRGRLPDACPSWRAAGAMLGSAGVTDLYLYAGSFAGAVGPLPGVPKSAEAARSDDPFPAAIAGCRPFGVRVHAWLPALQFEGAPEARFQMFEKAHRLLHAKNGTALGWLDPAVKANADDLARAAVVLARVEGMAGVHLDFMRYPDVATREKRSEAALESLLSHVRRELRAAAPDCELSVAVYGSRGSARRNVGQDWGRWLDLDLLDFAVPMNYAQDIPLLRTYMDTHKDSRDRIVCGLGPCARESSLEPDELVEQLREAYSQGFAGAALYAFDDRFVEELLPALRIAR